MIGETISHYRILSKLGEGGMGAVFEARRQGLNKRVALKVLTLGGNPALTARFVQEARISASLEHPHVADCFDVGEVDGLPFLALEFLDGETLGARMERGPMGVTEIADVAVPVCSALHAAHQKGVVHRDLKPDNIFLARQVGAIVPKVLDFGIAKARTGSEPQGLTRTASIMGTPGYMSPEQAKDSKNVGPATDQFALGVILWESLTGRMLFEGESALEVLMKVVAEPAPPLRTQCPTVDAAFEALVSRLLEKDASRRFASMLEVGASLLPFASPELRTRWASEFGGVAVSPTPPPRERATSPPSSTDHATMLDTRSISASQPAVHTAAPVSLANTAHTVSLANVRRSAWIAVGALALLLVATSIAWRATRSSAPPQVDPSTLSALPPRPEATTLRPPSETTPPTPSAPVTESPQPAQSTQSAQSAQPAQPARSTQPARPAQPARPHAQRNVPGFLRRVLPQLGGRRGRRR